MDPGRCGLWHTGDMTTFLSRARGALVGLAVGDAVGTTNEFKWAGTFEPITDMVGGGPFLLKPGQWTDDTSMALCIADSLLATGVSISVARCVPRCSITSTSAACR